MNYRVHVSPTAPINRLIIHTRADSVLYAARSPPTPERTVMQTDSVKQREQREPMRKDNSGQNNEKPK